MNRQLLNIYLQLIRHDVCRKGFCTTSCAHGKKTRVPFDARFPVTARHVNRHKKGGSEKLEKILAHHVVQPTGIFNKEIGRFQNVPEMIPEFVVPDLTDFKLKPYVSYKVPEVNQTKLTARDLFNACYAKEISEKLSQGKITLENYKETEEVEKDKS